MFSNAYRQKERTGKYGTARDQYLQDLVTEFQQTVHEEAKEQVVAHLANFAYDPFNFGFLRTLNVLDLFLDCLTESNEKLVEYALGGICNCVADSTNAGIVVENGGIPLIIQCLSSPIENTVLSAIATLYYLCTPATKKDILNPDVLDCLNKYANLGAVNIRFSNLAQSFLATHFHRMEAKEEHLRGGKMLRDHGSTSKYSASFESATTSGNYVAPFSSSSGTPIRGARVSPRPGAALALAAASSRQVSRTTSTSVQRGPLFEQGSSARQQHSESDDFSFENLAAREIASSSNHLENDIPRNMVRVTESTSLQSQGTGEDTLDLSSDTVVPDENHGSLESKRSSLNTVFDWKSRSTSSSVDMEHYAVGATGFPEHSLKAIPSFSDALSSPVRTATEARPQVEPMISLIEHNEINQQAEPVPSATKHTDILQKVEPDDPLFEQNEILHQAEPMDSRTGQNGILQQVEPMDSLLNHYDMLQDEEEELRDVKKLQNLIGAVDEPQIFDQNNMGNTSSDGGSPHAEHGYASSISLSEGSSDSGTGLINTNQELLSDDMDEAVSAPETNLEPKDDATEKEPRQPPTALQLAEELEMRNATSGLHWEEGAAAQPMRLEGIQRGPPAIGLLQLDAYNTLSQALASPFVRREHGFPQALSVHANFIAVGLSKGAVLVTPSKYSATRSADELESQKAFFLGGGLETKEPVSSLCFSHQGDLLLVGYANGILRLWDVSRRSMSKMMSTEHSEAIVHTLFLGQDAPGARSLRVISGDSKGKLLLHSFSQQMLMPLLRRFSVETQCLLEGDKTGPVLSVSPLLPDEGFHAMNGVNSSSQGRSSHSPTLGSVMGGMGSVVGGMVGSVGGMDVGRKFLYDGATPSDEGSRAMFVLVTHHTVLVVRLAFDMQAVKPLEVMSKLTRPTGIRDGAIAYTAWRRIRSKLGSSVVSSGGNADSNALSGSTAIGVVTDRADVKKDESDTVNDVVDDDDLPMLAMGWDTKMFIWQLTHSNLRKVREWELDSPAVGLVWLEEQMLVIVTAKDELCLFTKEGVELERGSIRGEQEGVGALIYHTHIMNALGNPEKAYHSSLSVRGAALYLMGPHQLWRARLLPWRERIKALEDAGDWMGAFHIAMELYDGRARGVTGLPRGLDAMRDAIMSTLLSLLSAYIDMAFEYLSVAFGSAIEAASQQGPVGLGQDLQGVREQYARVGGVAIEFCVHIGKQDVLFRDVFSKFVAVGQRGTFLELLEPYILKDMLGGLAAEVMQALVEHYSHHGWLERVEQCVLHMDIGSLDFHQVVRLCKEHGLYSALIYLYNRGLDDFISPLEELLTVADQASNLSQTQLVGYKLLVYLKYCFSGLAFPPGHGFLSTTRLPGLRAEILQFLLDQEGSIRGRSLTSFNVEESGLYPRLWFLLHVDVQATLLVLRLAFPEHGPLGIGKQGFAYLTSADDEEFVLSASEDVHDGVRYVQATVNALIEILKGSHEFKNDSTEIDTHSEDSKARWPSNEDAGFLLDFVAQFVASRHAVVSSSTFMKILEYVASPTVSSEVARAREDLMVKLLSAVPDSNLDGSRTLLLAQNNNYWQVSGLLHTRLGDYEAALDDYLSDNFRAGQPFVYIMQMLDHQKGLKESDLIKFREAVLLRIPQLVQRSSKGILWIVLKHLSSENQQIIEKLGSHPKLLFGYMKGIMDARPGGNNSSGMENPVMSSHAKHKERLSNRQRSSSGKFGRVEQWEPNVDIRDLLQRSDVVFTDDMAELYVELLCQFEPHAVLKFLESYENYRLEHCLKLCQEYGITDAAIFLLERVGDVASALNLVLKDLDRCRDSLELSVSTLSSTSVQAFDKDNKLLFGFPEVGAVRAAVAAAVTLCQRNTQRLDPHESTMLWFRLLDNIVEPSKGASDAGGVLESSKFKNRSPEFHKSSGKQELADSEKGKVRGRSRAQRKVVIKQAKGKLLKKVLVSIMGDIIDGMMGYIPLHIIMEKILADHGNHPFGDFRPTILNMLSAYGFERTILGTAKHLIEEDSFHNIYALRQGNSHGYAACSSTCCICGLGLEDSNGKAIRASSRSSNAFSIYPCGHAAHIVCIADEDSNSEDTGSLGCPVCSLKVKSSTSSHLAKKSVGKAVEEASIGSSTPRSRPMAAYLAGSAMKSNSHATEVSRLAVLKQLQQGKQLSDLGPSLKLHLAPPQKIRPRRATVPESSGTSRMKSAQKSSMSLRR